MNETLRILGIPGSLRRASYNLGLLRAAQDVAPPGSTIEIYEDLAQIPLYNADVEAQGDPAPVQDLKQHIRASAALLIATPEYNYGVPGVLKNAIDWASRPPIGSVLNHKPIAIMGASPGSFGTARSQLSLRQSLLFTKSYVLIEPEVLVFRAAERFDANSNLHDQATRTLIRQLIEGLIHWTRELQAAGEAPRAVAAA
jgi:chromate reductase, NAD(P)H dehydrogenase (quinone)